ncbi:ribosomal RNA processing protein 36 homolog [Leptopilina boulardi]|uniref:ribosomal RNA processing protein 36 homolog n=1 Tax=Leptopilina boulardi TaxID=63433 RepID=UPI0021F5C167|nr:ribosomal RNA processing protein 36 homolog [Leptopilina boulardi]
MKATLHTKTADLPSASADDADFSWDDDNEDDDDEDDDNEDDEDDYYDEEKRSKVQKMLNNKNNSNYDQTVPPISKNLTKEKSKDKVISGKNLIPLSIKRKRDFENKSENSHNGQEIHASSSKETKSKY